MKISEKAAAELRRLEDNQGKLTPQQVIEAARNEKSALHQCFTWDDGEAAERWRMEEAREIIRSVRIEITIENKTVRSIGYVRDPECKPNESGYVSLMRVKKRSEADVLRDELESIA
jgi:hypothetical protein